MLISTNTDIEVVVLIRLLLPKEDRLHPLLSQNGFQQAHVTFNLATFGTITLLRCSRLSISTMVCVY